MQYNGAAVIAMVGKNCVGIANDRRYGIQQQTMAGDFDKVFKVNDKLFIGLSGLATDMQTLWEKMQFRVNMFRLREERDLKPQSFAKMVSTMLYEHRFGPFFIEPVIAGLNDDNSPFICSMDLIGCPMFAKDFVVSGSSSESLYGMCEALYKPDMEPDDLFETLGQCLLNAVDRDCISGWGATVTIITPQGVTIKNLKSRQD